VIFFPFRIVRKILAVLLILVIAYVGSVAVRVWWTARQDDRRPSDVIIVLGASQYDGRPSAVFAARLDHARDLFAGDVAGHVITVGGSQPGDRFTEAAAGKRYHTAHGVPEGAIVAVQTGSDTLQSLRSAASTMRRNHWDTAVLVTDPPHALRSRTMARDQGIDAVVSPTRSGPAVRERSTQLRYIARETAAFIYYRIFGRSFDGGPSAL
jgi:uncharacterized SAM-binding protein YcdF (DUF218 family)